MCIRFINSDGSPGQVGDCEFSNIDQLGFSEYEIENNEGNMGSLGQILTENTASIVEALNGQSAKEDLKVLAIQNIKSELKSQLGVQLEQLDIQKEIHEFERVGVSTLKDSLGQTIKPREAKALKDAEQGIEEKRMNNVNHGTILDETEKELNDLYNTNLIDTVLGHYKDIGDNNNG